LLYPRYANSGTNWLTKYRRNRINFVFFVRTAMLILRGQWGWFWRKIRPWGFLYRLTCHLVLLYHYRVSFVPLPLLGPSLVFTPRCSA
jgi:hypothetical protein